MSNRNSLASSLSSFKSISRQNSKLETGPRKKEQHFDGSDYFPIYFVDQPSAALTCKCCEGIFRTPVVLNCGHTACKTCSFQYANCPICSNEMRMVIENLALQDQIGQLEIYCDYGIEDGKQYEDGCPQVIQLSNRKAHLEICEYCPVPCPNSNACPKMKRKDLSEHLQDCNQARCRNHAAGCPTVGEKKHVKEHQENCIFALMGEALSNAISAKLAEHNDLSMNPVIRRFDERLNIISIDMENISNSLTETKRFHQEINELRNDISLLSNQLNDLTSRFNTGAIHNYEPQKIFKVKGTFVGHQGQVWCLAVTGDILFSGAGDAEIKCWDTASNYCCQKTLQGHTQPILAMTTTAGYLFSTGLDCSIHIWHLSNLSFVSKLEKAHDKAICSIAASQNFLFTGSLNIIKVWKIHGKVLQYVENLSDVSNYVRAMSVYDSDLYAGSNKLITIWNIDTMKIKRQITIPGEVFSLHILKGYILAGTDEKLIHVWKNDNSTEIVCRLRGHAGTVHSLASLSTGDNIKVFSASADRCLRVWSMENMLCTQALDRHQGSVTALAVSRGRVFSASVDQTVKVWV